jgi:hypothetical protein
MSALVRTVILWSAIDILGSSTIARWRSDGPGLWTTLLFSCTVFGLAGWHATRNGPYVYGVFAGAAVGAIEQLTWILQGAPGHADTSDLPEVIQVLTYVTTVLFVAALGAICGAAGGLVGWTLRRRARRESSVRAQADEGDQQS